MSVDRGWRFRWCVDLSERCLHRVVGGRATRRHFVGIVGGRTLCGKFGTFHMPGILARMYRRRCAQCCRAAGIPWGSGAPFNQYRGRLQDA